MEEEKIQPAPQNENNDIVVSTEVQNNNQQSNSGEPISTNNNFTKYMQKKLAKAKRKSLQYGVTIPDLKYELTAPEKPRAIFSIVGYIMIAIGLAIFVGATIWFISSGIFSVFGQLVSGATTSLTPEMAEKTLGFSALAGAGAIFICIFIAIVMLIPTVICIALVALGIKNINLTHASRQEMAVGYEVTRYLLWLISIMFFSVLAVIIFAIEGFKGSALIAITIIASILIIICAVLFAIILQARKKDKVWFETLPEDRKQDFIAQNKMLKEYSSRKRMYKTNLGDW